MDHRRTLEAILEWASGEENVRAVILTGSGARGEDEIHDLSDLDLELYVREPAQLLDETGWYEAFGDVLVVEALPNPGWHPTRLVYYVDGKVDFMVAPVAALAEAMYTRPFRVLVDKDGLAGDLEMSTRPDGLPDEEAFLEAAHWFYAAALMCAKCIVRGELWLAKHRDWDLKGQLLRMIEWDHKAKYGIDYDTRHKGAKMDDWMDADVRDAVTSCWGRFSGEEMAEALRSSVELFETLRVRTATALGWAPEPSMRVRAEIERILALRHSLGDG